MDPSKASRATMAKGLYLPIFGFGYIYYLEGGYLQILLIFVTSISAAYTDTFVKDIARTMVTEKEIKSVRDAPLEEWREYFPISFFSILVVVSFGIYVWSILKFGVRGRDSVILGTLALIQFVILVRSFTVGLYYSAIPKMVKGI